MLDLDAVNLNGGNVWFFILFHHFFNTKCGPGLNFVCDKRQDLGRKKVGL